ncbi:Dihydrosphingosine phosphate lyase [Spiromyces aspiralis]|uniref:Dihydrosphingosine phosphate lyase n=1 Tax=Spiromyces aspiralis TaxID=68401 RepID=A0ACC1HDS3_9FUNG|nr:Dihydrosphingosine phosphate lyase [Spiromyces aspiralis]
MPGASTAIDREVENTIKEIEKTIVVPIPDDVPRLVIPDMGVPDDDILEQLESRRDFGATSWEDGKVSGVVYHGGKDLVDLTNKAFALFNLSNPLHPDVFPGLRKIEAEIVKMVLDLYNAPDGACGATTSGGTESIIMAVRAHIIWARKHRGISNPNMQVFTFVFPTTAHAAFEKAVEYFGIEATRVPVDSKSQKVDINAVKRAINRNTCLIVGSAVTYPHGVADDIEALGKLAEKYKIGLHVDCCLGSFIMPFLKEAGFPAPAFDFRVAGVTSISCDTHKYGFAPKGSSVVMYRNKTLRHCQYYTITGWPGGIYASPSIAGSRPGSLIAGCWAAMLKMGKMGYLESCRDIVGCRVRIQAAIEVMPELEVIGDPCASVIAFGTASSSSRLNIFAIMDAMKTRGWILSPLQHPECVHLACTRLTVLVTDKFIQDIRDAIDEVKAEPEKYAKGSAAIYGMAVAIPDQTIVEDICNGFIDTLYEV